MQSLMTTLRPRAPTRYGKVAQAQHPLAYWPLSDASGSAAVDASGNARGGAYTGITLGATGIGDGRTAATYPGTGAVINAYSVGLAGAFNGALGSFAVWFKASASGVWSDATFRNLFQFQADTNNYVKAYKSNTANRITVDCNMGATFKTINIDGLSDTAWHLLTVTWDKAGNALRAYLDGVPQSSPQTGLGTWAGSLASTTTTIGATNLSGSGGWSGSLAHAALWNVALAAAQVGDLYGWRGGTRLSIDGDSRSIGAVSNAVPWPRQLLSLTTRILRPAVYAVSGQTAAQCLADAATEIDPLAPALCILLAGVNDALAGSNAAAIYASLLSYAQGRIAAGHRVAICTELPATSTAANNVTWNTTRATLNTSIRNGAAANGYTVIDLAADATIGGNAASDNTTYYNADKLHLTTAGYAIVAGVVATALGGL